MTALRPPVHWLTRPDTWDESMWRCVVDANEYNLPHAFSRQDVILDVGGHIGCFSYACLYRGAGHVIACEVDPENFRLLDNNLAPFQTDRATALNAAAWRSDHHDVPLTFQRSSDTRNTGGGGVMGATGELVTTVLPFDAMISMALRMTERLGGEPRIRLVKMDCEGSEFPILFTSRRLEFIEEIVGEYHLPSDPLPAACDGLPDFTVGALAAHLMSWGFTMEATPSTDHLGHFRALRCGPPRFVAPDTTDAERELDHEVAAERR